MEVLDNAVESNNTTSTTDEGETKEKDDTTTPKIEDSSTTNNESIDVLDEAVKQGVEPQRDRSVSDILSSDRSTPKGEFIPDPSEYRNYEDWFGNKITEGLDNDDLSAKRVDPRFQDLRKMRAQAQGPLAESANALKAVPKIPLGIVEQAGYLLDFTRYDDILQAGQNLATGKEGKQELDVTNPLSEAMRDASKAIDEMAPIYKENPNAVWDMTDTAWWAQNGSMLTETIGEFAATGYGISKGVGLLAKGVKAGVGAGAGVNTIRGGAQVARGIDKTADLTSAALMGHAEGSMVGMQTYDQTYKNVKEKLRESDEDLTPSQIEQRAKTAASQSAATATAVNSVVFPFLNYTSARLLSSRTPMSSGVSKQLKKQLDELDTPTRENLQSIKSKLDDFDPQVGGVTSEAKRVGRESVQESVEELGAVVAEEEGREKGLSMEGMGTERSVGERLSDALFTPQAALEATLGAVGGAGQFGIMSNIPSVDVGDQEGKITQREFRRRRRQQQISTEKDLIADRIDKVTEAQNLLQQAEEADDPKRSKILRSRGMRKLKVANSASSVARGVSHQIKRMYQGLMNMDKSEAENEGLDTDPESDTHYEKVAQEQIEDIEKYEEEYQNLVNNYQFSAEEDLAGVPRILLQQKIQEDQAKKNIEELEAEREEEIDLIEEHYGEFAQSIAENRSLEAREEAMVERNEILFELINQIDNLDSNQTETLSLEEFLKQNSDKPWVSQINETLSQLNREEINEIFDNTRDLSVNEAQNLLNSLASQRESELAEIKKQKADNPYQEFLDANNLEDTEENRKTYEHKLAQMENDQRSETVKSIESAIQNEKDSMESAKERFNKIVSSDGRKQIVERAEEIRSDNRGKLIDQIERTFDQANTVEELERLYQKSKDIGIQDEVKSKYKKKLDELKTDERRAEDDQQREDIKSTKEQYADDEDAKEKIKEDLDRGKEQFVETISNAVSEEETEEDENVAAEEEKETDLSEEEEQSAVENLTDTVKQKAEKAKDAVTPDNEPEGELQGPNPASDEYNKAKQRLNEFIGENYHKINESIDNPEKYLEDTVDEMKSNSNADLNWEGLKNHAIREYERRMKLAKDDEAEAEKVEDTKPERHEDSPPENPERDASDISDNVETPDSSVKNPEIGHTVTYLSQPQTDFKGTTYNESNERLDDLEYPLIEHWDYVKAGENVELTVMNDEFGDDRDHVRASDLPNDLDSSEVEANQLQVDNAVIGIYYTEGDEESFIGYLSRPDRIDESSTPAENIEEQLNKNREIRRTVVENYMSGKGRTRGKVTSKTPGQLTRNWSIDENGDIKFPREKVPQTVNKGFPNQQLEYYIISGQTIENGETTQDVDKNNLVNKKKFFEGNEGSAGLLVQMGNGQKMAVPVWLPKIENIDESIKDTVYELSRRMTEDNPVIETNRGPDIDLAAEIQERLEDYIYVTERPIFEILNNENVTENRVIVGDKSKDVHFVDKVNDVIYSTDQNMVRNNEDVRSLSEGEDRVKEIIGQMRFNIDVSKINQYDNNADNYRVSMNDNNQLEIIDYNTYNDFISDHILTDLDASYSITNPKTGQQDHLVYQHPTPRVELSDQTSSKSTSAPNLSSNHKNENAGTPREEFVGNVKDQVSSDTQEDTENKQDSEVQGDSEDIETPAGDAQSRENSNFDAQSYNIADKIQESDEYETVDDYIQDNEDTVEGSTAKDLRDEVETILENREQQSLQDRFDEITEGVGNLANQSTQDLEQIKSDLESLRADLDQSNSDLLEEVEEMIDNVGVELTGRDGINNTESGRQNETDNETYDETLPEEDADDIVNDLFDDYDQRTPNSDVDISETTDTDKTIEQTAEENNDYNCKT